MIMFWSQIMTSQQHKEKLKHWQQQHSKNTTWSEFAILQIVPQLFQLEGKFF